MLNIIYIGLILMILSNSVSAQTADNSTHFALEDTFYLCKAVNNETQILAVEGGCIEEGAGLTNLLTANMILQNVFQETSLI